MKQGLTLVTWLGVTDYQHAFGGPGGKQITGSPLVAVMTVTKPSRVLILWGDGQKTPAAKAGDYLAWLRSNVSGAGERDVKVHVIPESDGRVMDFGWVYQAVESTLAHVPPDDPLTINASSGTSIMTAAWIVYAKSTANTECELLVSSPERGVQQLELPPGLKIDLRRMIAMTDDDPLLDRYRRGELFSRHQDLEPYVGKSRQLLRVKFQAHAAARFPVPVLITGGPGTGKSLLAEVIHKLGPEKDGFVTVDCGQMYSPTEIHSVFGWEKGAFTGADKANPGLVGNAKTLFFDEIGNAPPQFQAGLLRFLQTGKYRPLGRDGPESDSKARVIAATNTDLYDAVRKGVFRQDLFDRLRTVQIQIPSLAERNADIIPIARHKLTEFQRCHDGAMRAAGVTTKRLSVAAEKVLRGHDWPGNIRELEHLIARVVIFCDPGAAEISGADVQRHLSYSKGVSRDSILNREIGQGFDLEAVLREVQWHYVRRASQETTRNKAEMARLLGYGDSRTPLNTMLKNFESTGLADPLAE